MLDPSLITAVIPTRGDVDMTEIRESLKPFGQVIVWNNAHGIDKKVYGRYMAVYGAENEIIYTQDDDCLVDWRKLLPHYHPDMVTCNMPHDRRYGYRDGTQLIGWGCLFHRRHAIVLEDYLTRYPGSYNDFFFRTCDRIFTKLNTCNLVAVPFRHLEHAYGDSRMAGKGNALLHRDDTQQIREKLSVWPQLRTYCDLKLAA